MYVDPGKTILGSRNPDAIKKKLFKNHLVDKVKKFDVIGD